MSKSSLVGKIMNIKVPKTRNHVRSFLGLIDFYRKFVPGFGEIVAYLIAGKLTTNKVKVIFAHWINTEGYSKSVKLKTIPQNHRLVTWFPCFLHHYSGLPDVCVRYTRFSTYLLSLPAPRCHLLNRSAPSRNKSAGRLCIACTNGVDITWDICTSAPTTKVQVSCLQVMYQEVVEFTIEHWCLVSAILHWFVYQSARRLHITRFRLHCLMV